MIPFTVLYERAQAFEAARENLIEAAVNARRANLAYLGPNPESEAAERENRVVDLRRMDEFHDDANSRRYMANLAFDRAADALIAMIDAEPEEAKRG